MEAWRTPGMNYLTYIDASAFRGLTSFVPGHSHSRYALAHLADIHSVVLVSKYPLVYASCIGLRKG